MLLAERAENERLRQIIKELQRHRFGRRAESLPEDQLLLGLEEAEQVEAAGPCRARRRRSAKRVERTPASAAPTADRFRRTCRASRRRRRRRQACPCCRGRLHRIGEDVSERLDIVPAQFRVLVMRRPKYACRACEEVVVQAPAPARLIEGGMPTEATVAQVLVSKYADHLPLYRQAQIYARQGVNLDRSTLADWVGRAAFLLRPVHERLLERLKASTEAVRRRDHGAGARSGPRPDQDRPALGLCPRRPALGRSRSAGRRLCLCARPQGRAADRAISPASRASCRSTAMRGYKVLAERGAVSLAFCWSHVRRQLLRTRASRSRRRSPARRSRASPSSISIEGEIRGRSRRRAPRRPPRAAAGRSSRRSSPGCATSSRSSARRPNSPRRSATRSRAGRA